MDIAILIIGILSLIVAGIIGYRIHKRYQDILGMENITRVENKLLQKENFSLAQERNELISEINKLRKTKTGLGDEINSLRTKMLTDLDKSCENARNTLNKILTDIGEKERKKKELEEATKKLSDAFERLTTSTKEKTETMKAFTAALEQLSLQHQEATKRQTEQGAGRTMSWKTIDKELTELLEELKEKYPQLFDVFSAAEWTKIWQPKFQAMTNDISPSNDLCGIYRIWTIEKDGSCRNYVGQARKIRDRWSQHIKSMLGVSKSDNHKFYSNVKPYNAHFEIIEECSADQLNEREHY